MKQIVTVIFMMFLLLVQIGISNGIILRIHRLQRQNGITRILLQR